MSDLFADTSFFVAFLNHGDDHHASALRYMAEHRDNIVTTNLVLVELANFLAPTRGRKLLLQFLNDLQKDERFVFIPVDDALIERGLRFYGRRPDKRWSLTDCISFIVMQGRGITEALTADHHFHQAGFDVLLKP